VKQTDNPELAIKNDAFAVAFTTRFKFIFLVIVSTMCTEEAF
jgi:hypothetical protein